MKVLKPKNKTCSRGHDFVKSKDLPVCPRCYPGYYKRAKSTKVK